MSAHGADLITLRPCFSCGEWPYVHANNCPVGRAEQRRTDQLAALVVASMARSGGGVQDDT